MKENDIRANDWSRHIFLCSIQNCSPFRASQFVRFIGIKEKKSVEMKSSIWPGRLFTLLCVCFFLCFLCVSFDTRYFSQLKVDFNANQKIRISLNVFFFDVKRTPFGVNVFVCVFLRKRKHKAIVMKERRDRKKRNRQTRERHHAAQSHWKMFDLIKYAIVSILVCLKMHSVCMQSFALTIRNWMTHRAPTEYDNVLRCSRVQLYYLFGSV